MVAATLEGMPDEELLGQLTDYFQQRREIAVDVLVRAPEAVSYTHLCTPPTRPSGTASTFTG